MKIDYDVGDVVVKVDGEKDIGRITRCTEICVNGQKGEDSHTRGPVAKFSDYSDPNGKYEWLWAANFKKLPKADEDFTAYMRKMKPKQTEKPRCPLTGEPLTVGERFEQECG